jgi:hypothetical protein
MEDIIILEEIFLRLFHIYNNKLSDDFKTKLLNIFKKSFTDDIPNNNKKYKIRTSHKCNYPRTQNRGFCNRNCFTQHCNYHMKNIVNHIESYKNYNNFDDKINPCLKLYQVKSNKSDKIQISLPDLPIIDVKFSDYKKEYIKIIPLDHKKTKTKLKCIFLDNISNCNNSTEIVLHEINDYSGNSSKNQIKNQMILPDFDNENIDILKNNDDPLSKKKKKKNKKKKNKNRNKIIEEDIFSIDFSYIFKEVANKRNEFINKHQYSHKIKNNNKFMDQTMSEILKLFHENKCNNQTYELMHFLSMKYDLDVFNYDNKILYTFSEYRNRINNTILDDKIDDFNIPYIKKYLEFTFKAYNFVYNKKSIITDVYSDIITNFIKRNSEYYKNL